MTTNEPFVIEWRFAEKGMDWRDADDEAVGQGREPGFSRGLYIHDLFPGYVRFVAGDATIFSPEQLITRQELFRTHQTSQGIEPSPPLDTVETFGWRFSLTSLALSLARQLWPCGFLTDPEQRLAVFNEQLPSSLSLSFEKQDDRLLVSSRWYVREGFEDGPAAVTTLDAFAAGVRRFIDELLRAIAFYDPGLFAWPQLVELLTYLSDPDDRTVPGRSHLDGLLTLPLYEVDSPSLPAFRRWRVVTPGGATRVLTARLTSPEVRTAELGASTPVRLYPIFPDEWRDIDDAARVELIGDSGRANGWLTVTGSDLLLSLETVARLRPVRFADLIADRARIEWGLAWLETPPADESPLRITSFKSGGRNALAFIDALGPAQDGTSALDHPSVDLWDRLAGIRVGPATLPVVERRAPALKNGAARVRWRFEMDESPSRIAAVADGLVYVPTGSRHFFALDEATGHERWRFRTGQDVSTPLMRGEWIYLTSRDQNVYALEAATGRERWRFATSSPAFTSLAVNDDTLYVACYDHRLHALDAETGQERWRFVADGRLDGLRVNPLISGGVVYVGGHDHRLYAIDAINGRERWRWTAGGIVRSLIAIRDGLIYLAGYDGVLSAVDVTTATTRWTFPVGSMGSPALLGEMIVASGADGELHALDVRDGRERWRQEFGSWLSEAPAADGRQIYLATHYNRVSALDRETGAVRWTFEVDDEMFNPSVADGVVYVGAGDNRLHALDAVTGAPLWRCGPIGAVVSAPTVIGGALYAASGDKSVYAISLD